MSGLTFHRSAQCATSQLLSRLDIVLRSSLPITSERFDLIKAKREEVALLMQQSALAEQSNDMLAFLQRDSFTLFLMSLLQNMLMDYRDELVRSGVNTQVLYVKDDNGVEQINGQSISKVVELKDFNVATAENNGAQQVTFTLLVIALPQCWEKNNIVDDSHWTSTLENMHAVATLVEDDLPEDVEKEVAVVVHDPECTGSTCISKAQNNAAFTLQQHGLVATIVAIVLVFAVVIW